MATKTLEELVRMQERERKRTDPVTFRDLHDMMDAAMKAVGKVMKELKVEIAELKSTTANASRVAEITGRVSALEARFINVEAKAVNNDNAVSGHRRHLAEIEKKIGRIVNPKGDPEI
jgi:hypothetical protein